MSRIEIEMTAYPDRTGRIWDWLGGKLVNWGKRLIEIGAWCMGIDPGNITWKVDDEKEV